MSSTKRTICVFCGSSLGKNPASEEAAHDLGARLAACGFRLVYGGGSIGLMGTLARSMLRSGGEVIGIIPRALLDREVGLVEATELLVTQTMRERKAMMDERTDAFIALPGGFGTLEELMETITLRQLQYHHKPIIIVNLEGFYTPLCELFAHFVDHGYVSARQRELYYIVETVDEAMAVLCETYGCSGG
jgi:hypothetical protein